MPVDSVKSFILADILSASINNTGETVSAVKLLLHVINHIIFIFSAFQSVICWCFVCLLCSCLNFLLLLLFILVLCIQQTLLFLFWLLYYYYIIIIRLLLHLVFHQVCFIFLLFLLTLINLYCVLLISLYISDCSCNLLLNFHVFRQNSQ